MFIKEHTTPLYFSGEVCEATGLDAITLQSWMGGRTRKAVILMGAQDREAAGTGRPRIFTLMRVYQIAIAHALVRRGFDPHRAAGAALHFSDAGRGPGGWAGDHNSPAPGRLPSQLFPDEAGETFLIIGEGPTPEAGNFAQNVVVACLPETATLHDLNKKKFWPDGSEDFGTVLRLNRIIERTRTALGLSHRQPVAGPEEADLLAELLATRVAADA